VTGRLKGARRADRRYPVHREERLPFAAWLFSRSNKIWHTM